MIKQGGDHWKPQKPSVNSWQGSAQLSPPSPSPPPSEFCSDEDNSVIRSAMDGFHEIFKKLFNLLTVTVLFLFTFFNLILDAPRIYLELISICTASGERSVVSALAYVCVCLCVRGTMAAQRGCVYCAKLRVLLDRRSFHKK